MAAGRKLVSGGPHRTQGMRLSEKPGTALHEYECGQPFRLPRQGIQERLWRKEHFPHSVAKFVANVAKTRNLEHEEKHLKV